MIWFAIAVLFCAQAAEQEHKRLTQINKSLLKALEVMVGEQSAEESVSLTFGTQDGGDECAAGKRLTEAQCKNDVSFGKAWGGADEYGGWWAGKESCGCYIDQNGKRYFNRRSNDRYCGSDSGEKLICIVPDPPKKCNAPFQFIEKDDGQCSYSVKMGNPKCAAGYEQITNEGECGQIIQRKSQNIHWRGSYRPPDATWPTGCVVYKRSGSSTYQGYFNTRNAECTNCDNQYAPLCKLSA